MTNNILVNTQIAEAPDKGFAALHALYQNKQQWIRHYETLLAQITPISTTASIGIAAFISEADLSDNGAKILLMVPLMLVGFTIWFNAWCDGEIRRQFEQVVAAEKGMGFYDFIVDGQPVLPKRYFKSAVRTRPIILAGYALQVVALGVLGFLAFIG